MRTSVVFFGIMAIAILVIAGDIKVKIKKDMVYVNEVEYVKWAKERGAVVRHELKNLNDSLLLIAVKRQYNDPKLISTSNKTGVANYLEFQDPVTGEIQFEYQGFIKGLFKSFYEEKVITSEGYLHETNFPKLANAIGKEFSRKRRDMN